MSLWYTILYRLGFTPWEEDPAHGPAAEQISALFDREEQEREPPPYGKVLDLGCGSGNWSVHLAESGWTVTGIDIVPDAIHRARHRARAAGVDAGFVEGDVAALPNADIGSDFSFVVDFECLNHLTEEQRLAVGRGVNAIAAPDATMLLLAWAPGRRGPLPPGASRSDIETAFLGWTVVEEDGYDVSVRTTPLAEAYRFTLLSPPSGTRRIRF